MNGEGIINWLSGLPITTLYIAIGAISAIENIFPPFPADAVVAFGSFLAARGQASPVSTFLVAWLGNLGGAGFTYWMGRKYGATALSSRLERFGGANAETRLRALYGRYGVFALFVSRFLPGVRALVPPFAGAMRLPAIPAAIAIASASGLWFAFVTWVAYRAGENWEVLYERIVRSGTILSVGAAALVLIGVGVWYMRRKKKSE